MAFVFMFGESNDSGGLSEEWQVANSNRATPSLSGPFQFVHPSQELLWENGLRDKRQKVPFECLRASKANSNRKANRFQRETDEMLAMQ